ncbi:uncharacterized protein LOC126902205 isoform X2 [Daktulosphaira vitifoliae]|uniref:uncharacterized protein LOC126902205 isoform X2 n=1 Tax=Daktulosphaira vitifoliae TaxID=58002 RepID=UPI0021A99897|nr:uncharacterized protein LOC126902205 isoform X2 [Daktulosphaira vitifoliae]
MKFNYQVTKTNESLKLDIFCQHRFISSNRKLLKSNCRRKNHWTIMEPMRRPNNSVYRQCLIASNDSWELAEQMWCQICTNLSVRLDTVKKPLKKKPKIKIPQKNKEIFQRLEELFGAEYLSSDEELSKFSTNTQLSNYKNKNITIPKKMGSYENSFDLLADLEDDPPKNYKNVKLMKVSAEVSLDKIQQEYKSFSPLKENESNCNSVMGTITKTKVTPNISKEKTSSIISCHTIPSSQVLINEQIKEVIMKETLNNKSGFDKEINKKSNDSQKYSRIITSEVKISKRATLKRESDLNFNENKTSKIPKLLLNRTVGNNFIIVPNKQLKKETSSNDKLEVVNETIPINRIIATSDCGTQYKKLISNQSTDKTKACIFLNNQKSLCDNSSIKIEPENQDSSSSDSGIEITQDIFKSRNLYNKNDEKQKYVPLGCLNFSNEIIEALNEMEIPINSDVILCEESTIKLIAHLFIDDDFLYKCDANPSITWNTSKSQMVGELITNLILKFCSMDNNMIYLSSCFMRIFRKIVDNQPYTLDIIRYRFSMFKNCIQKLVKFIDKAFYKQWLLNKYYEDWLYVVDYILKDNHSMLSLLVIQNKMVTSSVNQYIMNAREYFFIAKIHRYSFEFKNTKSNIKSSVSIATFDYKKNLDPKVPLNNSHKKLDQVLVTKKQELFPKISVKPEFSMKSFAAGGCGLPVSSLSNNLLLNKTIPNSVDFSKKPLNSFQGQLLPELSSSMRIMDYNYTSSNSMILLDHNKDQCTTFCDGKVNNLFQPLNPSFENQNTSMSDHAKVRVLSPLDISNNLSKVKNEGSTEFNYKLSISTKSPQITTSSSGNISNFSKTNPKIKCMGFNCSTNAIFVCLGCLKTHYCSQKCQASHWNKHKEVCSEMSKTFL